MAGIDLGKNYLGKQIGLGPTSTPNYIRPPTNSNQSQDIQQQLLQNNDVQKQKLSTDLAKLYASNFLGGGFG